MAFTRGRCTNFDYCSAAEARRDIDVPIGQDFVCPECGKALKAPPMAQSSGSSPIVPILIGVGGLALVGGAIFLGMQMAGGNKPAPAPVAAVAPATATAPATTTAAAAADDILVRLRASPTAGSGFGAKLAAAYLAQIGDTSVHTEAGTSASQAKVVGLRGTHREAILVDTDSTASGLAALGAGNADVVLAARRILPTERQALAALGDMSAANAEHVAAFDGLAVVVNNANLINTLTKEQAKGIFAGTIRNWSEVGGVAGDIHLYALADGSELAPVQGATVLANAAPTASAKRLADAAQVAAAVAADPLGVGIVDLAHMQPNKALPVADTGATPVGPTNRVAIATEAYPFAFPLYFYHSPAASSAIPQRFVEFAASTAGQTLAEQSGLVSLNAKAEAAAQPATTIDKFKQMIAGARRLGIYFLFDPNSVEPDQKGRTDVDRVANYMLSAHMTPDHLILVGFADNQGDPAANLAVSKKRADAVAALFIKRGFPPGKVAGFGSDLPVADNTKDDGRNRNRRVEVYLTP